MFLKYWINRSRSPGHSFWNSSIFLTSFDDSIPHFSRLSTGNFFGLCCHPHTPPDRQKFKFQFSVQFKTFPLGGRCPRKGADEGKILPLISQKSKIFASFSPGRSFCACGAKEYDKAQFGAIFTFCTKNGQAENRMNFRNSGKTFFDTDKLRRKACFFEIFLIKPLSKFEKRYIV